MSAAAEVKKRVAFAGTRTAYVRKGEILLRGGFDRIPDQDFAITRDPDFWDKVEGNATIRAARDYRRHLVAGARVQLEARTALQKALLPYAEALLVRIKGFAAARFGLADAPFRGMVVGRLHGHWEDGLDLLGDGTRRRWYVLDRIRIQLKGRWEMKRWKDEDGRVRFGWAVWDYGAIAGGEGPGAWRVPEHPEWYVHHRYSHQEDAIYGRDMGRVLYWLAHAEHILWESAFDTAERFGAPWIKANLKQDVAGFAPGTGGDVQSFAATAQAVLAVLQKLRAHNVVVGDERLLDVSLLEAGLQGANFVERLIDRIQQMVRILILGSNLPTSATQGGSFSLAQVQDESTRRLVRFDRELEAETLTDQVLSRLLEWNREALAAISHPDAPGVTLADVGTPLVSISDDEVDDPNLRSFQLSFAQAVPLPIRDEELYALGKFTPPAEGEKATTLAPQGGAGGLPFVERSRYDECGVGQTAAQTGCVPEEGGGGKRPAIPKIPVAAHREAVKVVVAHVEDVKKAGGGAMRKLAGLVAKAAVDPLREAARLGATIATAPGVVIWKLLNDWGSKGNWYDPELSDQGRAAVQKKLDGGGAAAEVSAIAMTGVAVAAGGTLGAAFGPAGVAVGGYLGLKAYRVYDWIARKAYNRFFASPNLPGEEELKSIMPEVFQKFAERRVVPDEEYARKIVEAFAGIFEEELGKLDAAAVREALAEPLDKWAKAEPGREAVVAEFLGGKAEKAKDLEAKLDAAVAGFRNALGELEELAARVDARAEHSPAWLEHADGRMTA